MDQKKIISFILQWCIIWTGFIYSPHFRIISSPKRDIFMKVKDRVSHYQRELKLIKFNKLTCQDWICMFTKFSFSAKGTGKYQIHQAFLMINMVIKSLTKWIHQLLWGVVECWVGVIYLYSLTKGSLESMQVESIVCNLWIQGVWNLRSIVVTSNGFADHNS